jgi:uncharacterized repeat protein (TIGR03803 family)
MIASKIQSREVKFKKPGIWVRAAKGASVLAILLALVIIAIPAAAQTFTVLHEFAGGLDGIQPAEGVAVDTSGNVYGMSQSGGGFNYGIVYRLSPAEQESFLHSFIGSEGLWPDGVCTSTLPATSMAPQVTGAPQKEGDALTVAERFSKSMRPAGTPCSTHLREQPTEDYLTVH